MADSVNNRDKTYDVIRLVAFFFVLLGHFDGLYREYEGTGLFARIIAQIVYIFPGKFAVAIFAIILGFFSSRPKKNLGEWIVSRYIYFFVCGLFINSLFFVKMCLEPSEQGFSIKDVIYQAVVLGDYIFPTFWCMRDFFVGGVLAQLSSRAYVSTKVVVAEIILFYCVGVSPFICACMMGTLLFRFSGKESLCRLGAIRYVYLSITVLLLRIAAPHYGSNRYYFFVSIIALIMLFMLITDSNVTAFCNRITGKKFLESYMAMYLIHTMVYETAGELFRYSNGKMAGQFAFAMVFFVVLTVIMVLSIPIQCFLDFLRLLVLKIIRRIVCFAEE